MFPQKWPERIETFLETKAAHCLLVKVDKSKHYALMEKQDYQTRLDAQFQDKSKFQKLTKDPSNTDQRLFNNTIKKLEPYLSQKTLLSMRPKPSIKKSYGLLKCHKEEPYPLRPIISNLNSIFGGA